MRTVRNMKSGARVELELPDASQGDFGTSSRGRGSEVAGYICPCETYSTDMGYI